MINSLLPLQHLKGRLFIVVGNYGSGKTEVAVNLSLELQRSGKQVQIADLDIVNPYFRCREAKAAMKGAGVRVVMPPGAQRHADLPIIVPEIKGMLHPAEDTVSIFDVGGDDVGATVLSSLREGLDAGPYQLLLVLNARRPFTDSVAGCLKMFDAIEGASRLEISGIVSNSHLVDETTPEIIVQGLALANDVAQAKGVPVVFVTAMESLADREEIRSLDVPVFRLKRKMLPPWLLRDQKRDIPGSIHEVDRSLRLPSQDRSRGV